MGAAETVVQEALCRFLQAHSLDDCTGSLDDVVLSYVITILEDLGDERNAEENIDVDTFVEMMEAYVPGFASINNIEICEWMFELANTLSSGKSEGDTSAVILNGEIELTNPKRSVSESSDKSEASNGSVQDDLQEQVDQLQELFPLACQQEVTYCLTVCEGDADQAAKLLLHRFESGEDVTNHKPRINKRTKFKKIRPAVQDKYPVKDKTIQMCSSITRDEDQKTRNPAISQGTPTVPAQEDYEQHVETLLEMFPGCCHLEVTHCLTVCRGDTDETVQLLLHRQETGESITTDRLQVDKGTKPRRTPVLEDKKVKEQMLQKYSYVACDDGEKTYIPVEPKKEPKKMIRYLENKVVSVKGERFTDCAKKDDSEEMKKTYINLKPARKYRFH